MSKDNKRGSSKAQLGQSSPNAQNVKGSSGKKARAKTSQKRKDTIILGQEKLPVRRADGMRQKVSAEDLIVENLVQRALGKQNLQDIKELYRRCDEKGLSSPAKRAKRPTAEQMERLRASIGQVHGRLWAAQNDMLSFGLAQVEDGELRLSDDVRFFLRTGHR